jgi:hypothetical protein
MIDLNTWPHRWFGFWREYGPDYRRCPSIRECIRPDLTAQYDKQALRTYMTTAQNVAMTSRASFPDPVTGERHRGAIGQMTDGVWTWMSDLPDYIDKYDVAIPTAWLREIQRNGYVPPRVPPAALARLDSPPVG